MGKQQCRSNVVQWWAPHAFWAKRETTKGLLTLTVLAANLTSSLPSQPLTELLRAFQVELGFSQY